MGWHVRHNPVASLRAGMRGRCPTCRQGALFNGLLEVRASCPVCGADLSQADSGDGPAVFVILVLGAVVVLAALLVQAAFTPPLWLHMAIWPVVIIAGAIGLLRPVKGVLIAQQFRTGAREASHDDDV